MIPLKLRALTPAGKVTNKLVALFSQKIAERSEAKSVKNQTSRYFDAKLRFALLVLLRSAIISEKSDQLIGHFTRQG
jgi:hypothetical protein